MANAKIGSYSTWSGNYVENLDAAKQLARGDSGKVFYVDQGSATYVVNLPQISTEIAGWHAKFFMTAANASVEINGFGVVAGGSDSTATSADIDDDKMYLVEIGHTEATVALSDGISWGGSASTVGSSIEIHCNGTYWFATGYGVIAADIVSVDS